jgi:hypothetical protein
MLREDVRIAIEAGKFHVFAIDTIDDGIELLTGVAAGVRGDDGLFPEGSANRAVEDTLTRYAKSMRDFAGKGRDNGGKEKNTS